jgi:hypothetical protein
VTFPEVFEIGRSPKIISVLSTVGQSRHRTSNGKAGDEKREFFSVMSKHRQETSSLTSRST